MTRSWHRRALVCVAATVLLAALVAPLPAFAIDDVAVSTVVTLPTPSGQKDYATSNGDIVVWNSSTGIFGYDNAAKKLFHLPAAPDWWLNKPVISGTKIVYGADNKYDSRREIWGYDLSTETTFVVCDEPGEHAVYMFDGDTVVWMEGGDSDSAFIRGRSLSTGEYFTVPHSTRRQSTPDVRGDWVVFSEAASHGDNIKAYNLVAKSVKTLCSWSGDQYCPRIGSTGFVVWQSVSNPANPSTMDLYGCKVSDGVIRKIAGGPGQQHNPTIGGNIITWKDDSKPGGYGLVGYDLLSNTRFGIAKSIASNYYIAGIENGTIARLYTNWEVRPRDTKVQLFYPTALDVISGAEGTEDSLTSGDRGLVALAPVAVPSSVRVATRETTVVLAPVTSWSYSALACALAGKTSPVLLISPTKVSDAALAKIRSLWGTRLVVAAAPSTISTAALAQLESTVGSGNVTFVDGGNFAERSQSVAKVLMARAAFNGTVLVAPSSTSSSLMAVPASVSKGLPLVLVGSTGLSAGQIADLTAAGAKKFVVVGGSVPASTVSRLRAAVGTTNVRVIVGTSVASTAEKFASWEVGTLKMRWNGLALASTSNWTHTPMAALSRGRADSVLLLTSPLGLSSAAKYALVTHHSSIRRVSFVGKSTVVSTAVRRAVRLAIK